MQRQKADRRTLYTINVIKEAFLSLINQKRYTAITVSEICHVAEISRSTFYLHFNSLNDVLTETIDDALSLTKNTKSVDFSKTVFSFEDLKENESLIPACQRIGNDQKYQKMLMDPDLSEYIISRIIFHEKDKVVPSIIKKTGLSIEDAETLFSYVIHGSFAVNRAHHFVKDQKWSHDVQILNKFTQGGYDSLRNKD